MKTLIWILSLGLLIACGDKKSSSKTKYEKQLNTAGDQFESGSYTDAKTSFEAAIALDPDKATAYSGLAWCEFKLNNLSAAATQFATAATKTNPPADAYAGWGFLLNAQKDYTGSNAKADLALNKDNTWEFTYGLGLSYQDLYVVKAENYFLLSDFASSLAMVKLLNNSFNADINTDAGRAALAKEIETRKGLAKR